MDNMMSIPVPWCCHNHYGIRSDWSYTCGRAWSSIVCHTVAVNLVCLDKEITVFPHALFKYIVIWFCCACGVTCDLSHDFIVTKRFVQLFVRISSAFKTHARGRCWPCVRLMRVLYIWVYNNSVRYAALDYTELWAISIYESIYLFIFFCSLNRKIMFRSLIVIRCLGWFSLNW